MLVREYRGPMADWGLTELLLRNVEFGIRGLQWQNAGKGQRPQPISLPDEKTRTSDPAKSGAEPEVVKRLRALGMVPPDE